MALDNLILVDEEDVEIALIQASNIDKKYWNVYKDFFNIVDLYKQSGLGVHFYYDTENKSYSAVPFKKKVGFIQ